MKEERMGGSFAGGRALRVRVKFCPLLCFFFCTAWSASLNQTTLRELLLNLKGNGSSSSWNTINSNPCDWEGVMCSGSNVTNLSFSDFNLTGTIPPEIGLLQSLITLDLSHNSLTGNIPLHLSHCVNLSAVDLSSNRLSGSIPAGLQKLRRLQTLDLSLNNLSGSIPAGLGSLTSLQKLNLDFNLLSGSIPQDFGNLTAITELSLSWNYAISGSIPKGLGDLGKLQIFSADQNNLSGEIPFMSMPNLTALNLASNRLVGEIPQNICASRQLMLLDLTNNYLHGSIPEDLGSCTTLSNLRLGENLLTGIIPESLGQLQNLVYFEADQNQLSGQIPLNITSWTSLALLNLAHNSLTGGIPAQLSQPSYLQKLLLSNNKFSGPIPQQLSQCQFLGVLDLSANQFTGSIPENICSLRLLTNLQLDGNSLFGGIPSSIGDCAQLVELQLGDNKLNGSIPPQIGNLSNLQVSLNLSLNELTGTIPDSLGRLDNLVSLDLSHNQISGRIPAALSNMSSLLDWNFSNNLLTGPVPKSGPLANSSPSSYANNTGLCGGPLPPCEDASHKTLTFWKAATVAIACTVVFLVLMSVLVLGYTHNWCGAANDIKDIQLEDVDKGFMRLSQQELLELTGGFNDGRVIGAGGLSTVYSASLADVGQVAVKRLSMENVPQAKKAFMTELRVLSRVKHINIVKVLGFAWGPEVKALLFQLMPNGSLHKHLHEIRPCRLDWSTRLQIAMGVAQALAYLHSDLQDFAVVHCDVKPSNILLDLDMKPKLSDFGVARMIFSLQNYVLIDASTTTTAIVRGSVGYIAPEYASLGKVAPEADVFSFGMVLLELISGRRPTDDYFQSTKTCTLRGWVHESLKKSSTSSSNSVEVVLDPVLNLSPFPRDQVMGLTSVALKCSSENPADRPTMRQVTYALEDICGTREFFRA